MNFGPEDRSALWHSFTESENVRMFDHVAQALGAALYCVEAQLWRVDEGGRIECDRDTMPTPEDVSNPPWADWQNANT